jgi:hypothetical protein
MVMKNIKLSLIAIIAAGTISVCNAQVSVTGSPLTPVMVTPSSICTATLMNPGPETNVSLDAGIYNSAGEELLHVRTSSFRVASGVNVISASNFVIVQTTYAPNGQGSFLQSQKQLPSGMFKHCIRVINAGGENEDEFCQDLDSENNSFLNLVFPNDNDTIETTTPLLTWTHSEPFTVLTPGESFRIVLVKMNAGQNAEEAVLSNQPLFIMSNIFRHDVQYPFDAPQLKEGESYGWQVQKMAAGGQGIIVKTESWKFTVKGAAPVAENKYAVLKKKPDGGFYTAANNKLYFRFEEDYRGSQLSCIIYDEKHQAINPEPENEQQKAQNQNAVQVKSNGYNRFEIDLEVMRLKTGFYYLEVRNEKNELFVLKFYVE